MGLNLFGVITKDIATGPSGTLITFSMAGTGAYGAHLTATCNGVPLTAVTPTAHNSFTAWSNSESGTILVSTDDDSGSAGTWTATASTATPQRRSSVSLSISIGL
jgi:hypothetical protein